MLCNQRLVWITYYIVYLAEMFTCKDVYRGAVFFKLFTEHIFLAIVLLVNVVLFAIVLLVNVVWFAILLLVNVVLANDCLKRIYFHLNVFNIYFAIR